MASTAPTTQPAAAQEIDERTRDLFDAIDDCDVKRAEAALKAGANPNARRAGKETPLHAAAELVDLSAEKQRVALVELLIKHGGDVNSRDRSAATPLMRAASCGSDALAAVLLAHGARTTDISADGKTPADYADESGNHSLAKRLRSPK